MTISLIGTNGFLSNEIGQYCNTKSIALNCYGMEPPKEHDYQNFETANLVTANIAADKLAQSDVIIYTSGAGIQSNLKESWELIYKLNTLVPIEISCMLSNKQIN